MSSSSERGLPTRRNSFPTQSSGFLSFLSFFIGLGCIMVAGPLHVLYTPSENELDPAGWSLSPWMMTLCFLFASFFPSSQRLFRDGKLWRQMEKRENNTVRFLVNAPADFWSKRPGRPAPDYTQTEKKRKETRTRGEKKEKKKVELFIRIFFLSLLSVIYFENFATGGKRRIGLLGTLCDAVVSALYILSPVVQTAGTDGQQGHKIT